MRGPFVALVMAPLIYGVLFPQPYLGQILRKIPIAVVDNDLSDLSQSIVQTLDASGAVSVAVRATTLAEAHAALDSGKAFAVVGIPPGTQRDVLKGVAAHIPIYADATYLFIFRTTGNGIAAAINTLSSELAAGGARTDGSLVKATLAAANPTDTLLQPIFNPVGGFASYIVPAVFVLILQQTLLIGAAALSGLAVAQAAGNAAANVLGRGIAHLTIFLTPLALYLVVLPRLYGFSALGDPLQLLALASVFILATSFMAQAVGAWFKSPETPTLSLPRHQRAAAVSGRLRMAARGDTQACAGRRHHLPIEFRDRRHRTHRPAGREPVGGGASVAGALDPCDHIFRARRDLGGLGQAEARPWLTLAAGSSCSVSSLLLPASADTSSCAPSRLHPLPGSCV